MTQPVGNPIVALDAAAKPSAPGPDSVGAPATQTPPPPTPAQPDLRLFIEKDDAAGVFVYRIIDRRTGDVVQQFPREQVLQLMQSPDYGPGKVIDAHR
jgi:flagellar protein FlaG